MKDADVVLGRATADMIRGMTRSKTIPDFVIDAFLQLKKLLDRVSGPINPATVARILLDLGFDAETNKFPEVDPEKQYVDSVTGVTDIDYEQTAPVVGMAKPDFVPDPVEVAAATGGTVSEPEVPAKVVGPEVIDDIPLKPGADVSFLYKGQQVNASVVSGTREQDELYYTLELEDGTTQIVHEDDVDEV